MDNASIQIAVCSFREHPMHFFARFIICGMLNSVPFPASSNQILTTVIWSGIISLPTVRESENCLFKNRTKYRLYMCSMVVSRALGAFFRRFIICGKLNSVPFPASFNQTLPSEIWLEMYSFPTAVQWSSSIANDH